MVSSLSGQSVALCGHPSQVASCFSHSAGMEKPSATGVRSVPRLRFTIRRAKNNTSSAFVHSAVVCLSHEGSIVNPPPERGNSNGRHLFEDAEQRRATVHRGRSRTSNETP